MPSYRLLHVNCRTGRRSKQLTRLERDVWIAYMLSADDFGVCPADAQQFRADDPWLRKERESHVVKAFDVLIRVGLVGAFDDGGDRYLYQPDWQDYQKIKHPSKTTRPPVPAELLEKCSPGTSELFLQFHPKCVGVFPLHARARDANANADANASSELERVQGKPTPRDLFDVHQRLFVAKYGRPPAYNGGKDARALKAMLDKHGLDGATALIEAFFASRDSWIAGCGHGIGPLSSATVQNKLIAELSGRAPRNDGRDWAREFAANG